MLNKQLLAQSSREEANDLLWTLSVQGVFCSLSPNAIQITGWTEEECVGKPFYPFVHPDDLARINRCYADVLTGEMVCLQDLRCLGKDGSYRVFKLTLVPGKQRGIVSIVLVLGSATQSVGGVNSDLDLAVFENEKKSGAPTVEPLALTKLLESLLANAPVGFALFNEELRLVCLNQNFSAVIGIFPERQTGLFFKDLIPFASDVITPMLQDILVTGKPVSDYEVQFPEGDNTELSRYALMSFSPIPDSRGEICGIATIAVDITERKRSDRKLKKISEELVRSNEALEAFCYIASHDLSEPLRTISSYIQLLERRFRGTLDQDANDYMQFAIDGTQRMRRLIDGTLEYARSGNSDREVSNVDCNEVLQTVLINLKVAIEESRCTVTYDDLPNISSDRLFLLQVMQNLIANAIKYHGASPGHVHVGIQRGAEQWMFSVADDGIGIQPEYLAAIFTPFRKLHTQQEYTGAGLGLAISQKNIERMGGRIWATSEFNKGSIFYFTLPTDPAAQTMTNGFIPKPHLEDKAEHESYRRLQ